ncbi:glycosyltransferase family 9 protein [Kribbella deserti]|uniref:Glycosyltransferase family 9 protein n=1 Tax=Kribbella deserti TaxID=1926257 RepID=A0ABV6QSA5_9ACTN
METVLICRPDNDGDVLLAGPAVRAVAASARVIMLVSPSGEQAAWLLPGVHDVVVWPCPWSGFEPPAVDPVLTTALIEALKLECIGRALILTSFHQSSLPMALILRLAGIRYIAAASADYPGSLLDLRHRPEVGHEVRRSLSLAAAAGFHLPSHDNGQLAVRRTLPAMSLPEAPFVVVHPGASVSARAPQPDRARAYVSALAAVGWRVLVTGSARERELTAYVAGDDGVDLGGRTTFRQLAKVLREAACVVVGNTGPAHLAAAVGTPVVSLFAPVVPAGSWAPWGVPTIVLGDQQAACRGTRARICPEPGHPCLSDITPDEVVVAVRKLIEEVAG